MMKQPGFRYGKAMSVRVSAMVEFKAWAKAIMLSVALRLPDSVSRRVIWLRTRTRNVTSSPTR